MSPQSEMVLARIPARSPDNDPANICVVVHGGQDALPRAPRFISRATLAVLFDYAESRDLTVVVMDENTPDADVDRNKVIGQMSPVARVSGATSGYYGDGYAGAVYVGGMLRRGESRPHTGGRS